MEREVQAFLVSSADRKIKQILKEFSQKEYGNMEYGEEIGRLLSEKVIEVPNPQIWVEDEYFTNSTIFSLTNMAKFPWTYSARPTTISIPVDNYYFGKNVMDAVKDVIFYDRALGEWTNMFHRMMRYYPTHTIEVHDFTHALFTFWAKATFELLEKVEEHHKRFFTHKMINQFLASLLYKDYEDSNYVTPNIKLIGYDLIGLQTQIMLWNLDRFEERFQPPASFIVGCLYEYYQRFWYDFSTPLRSVANMGANVKIVPIELRHTKDIEEKPLRTIQSLESIFMKVNTKRFSKMFKAAMEGSSLTEILNMLDSVNEQTKKHIELATKYEKTNAKVKYSNEFDLEERNIKTMLKRGISFTEYKYSYDILPSGKIFSEVILNMDEFRRVFPTATQKQFVDVYNMAQTINSCRRSFANRFERDDWDLLVTINGDCTKYLKTLNEVTEKLCSDNMDNYKVRLK